MIGRRSRNVPPKRTEATKAGKHRETGSSTAAIDAANPDAANSEDAAAAKASVHEAIGKLIGDDDERRRGTAEKKATDSVSNKSEKPTRP